MTAKEERNYINNLIRSKALAREREVGLDYALSKEMAKKLRKDGFRVQVVEENDLDVSCSWIQW